MKIKTKIHLFSTLLMLVILALTNVGVYFLFSKMAYDTEYNQLRQNGGELISTLSTVSTEIDTTTILRAYSPPNGAVRIIDSSGKKLISVHSGDELEKFEPKLNISEKYSIQQFENTIVLSLKMPVILSDGKVAELLLIQQLKDVEQNLKLLRVILLTATVVAMIPIIASSMAIGRIVTQPIERLIEKMSQIRRSGTYEKIDIPQEGKDEMSLLGQTFNEMMEQLEENYKKQEHFVSNASHELKTPLTVIESYARLLSRRGYADKAVADESVGAILSESVRMKEMIEQMLQLARSNDPLQFEFSPTNITEVIHSTVQPMQQAFGRTILIEGIDSVVVNTDAKKLKQLLFIILDNARKYSQKEIKVSLKEQATHLVITVTDYGNGIPKDALPHVFDRFYRVHEDRSRKTGGTGLGLSIAKEIAEGLNGTLTIDSIVGMGTTVYISIPK